MHTMDDLTAVRVCHDSPYPFSLSTYFSFSTITFASIFTYSLKILFVISHQNKNGYKQP
ncbi:hypothetical protein Lalb_Chr04g0252641 [Lupinus albus]|uniref:Uncharacterized protein n=1 Tax=Lupinus albus TaxID=3870 RepID=A0A6A4QLP6_LUPAL|nr:hypothetical protein Lalb_Chr04g0252641 [Lupinus albus]